MPEPPAGPPPEPPAGPPPEPPAGPPPEPPAGPPPKPAPPPGRGPTAGVPWESQRELGLAKAFLETLRQSLLEPTGFFRKVDPEGRILPALLYAVVIAWLAVTFGLLWNLVLPNPFAGVLSSVEERRMHLATSLLTLSVFWLLVPIWIPAVLLFMAGIYHVVLLVLGGPSRGYAGTLRTLAYAGAPQLFTIVPFCGSLIGIVWGLVLQVIGLREVHGIQTGKSVAVVLIPMLLCVILVVALGVLVLMAVMGAAAFGSR